MSSHSMLQTSLTDDVKRIYDQFSECFGIRIVFYDAQKQLFKSGLDQPDCTYCQLIQQLYGPEPCMLDNECGRVDASKSGELTTYQCHAGLIESILPILEDSCLLGYAMIGQIRSTKQMPAQVARDWKSHYNSDQLRKAFLSKEYTTQKRLDSILSLFSIFADFIIKNHLVKLNVDSYLMHVLEYMREHIHEPFTLQNVAQRFECSPFTISHAFTRQLGQSFKQVQIEMKLTAAEELMRTVPDITVTKTAEELGYEDPLYFSRLYRKHRGFPPSVFLERQQPQ